MPPRVRAVIRMFIRAGLVYRGTRGSHHHFENPKTGQKYTIAGNPSKELDAGAWERVQEVLAALGYEQ